jgi:hypothetical protein
MLLFAFILMCLLLVTGPTSTAFVVTALLARLKDRVTYDATESASNVSFACYMLERRWRGTYRKHSVRSFRPSSDQH